MKAEVINPNRSDVLMERVAQNLLERAGIQWNSGVGNVVLAVIRENAPRVDLDSVTVARELGILKKTRRTHGV